ncbi:MAG: hypothetical protein QW390_05200, partial [Candidatus Bathyarchaeia archaeon]
MKETTAVAPYRHKLSIGESRGVIISDVPSAIDEALAQIRKDREALHEYLLRYPAFYYSLKPVDVSKKAPLVVQRMAEAASSAGVGPMAAVAGAIIDQAFEKMTVCGARVAIIENGGEVVARSDSPVYAGIYAGPSPLSGRIAFKLSHF